jgi:hypothetical protein
MLAICPIRKTIGQNTTSCVMTPNHDIATSTGIRITRTVIFNIGCKFL